MLRGYDESREALQGYLNRMTDAEMEILNLAGAGNGVLTERVGHFAYDGGEIHVHVMGAFEVAETTSKPGVINNANSRRVRRRSRQFSGAS